MPRFDNSPVAYWLLVLVLSALLLGAAYRTQLRQELFLLLSLGFLFVCRLPSLVYNLEINPDESQMITQALTLRFDPVYFRSVDGTTGGPLNSYLLILPSLFGLPFDYISARLLAFVLVAGHLYLLFRTIRLWTSELTARQVLIFFVVMLGITQSEDFLHYSSELLATLLLASAYYLYARQLRKRAPSLRAVALPGLLMGLIPFAKLQGVPMAAVVTGFVGLDILTRTGRLPHKPVTYLLVLIGSALTFPALVVGTTLAYGVFDDLMLYYIKSNLIYQGDATFLPWLLHLPWFLAKVPSLASLLAVLLMAGIPLFFKFSVPVSLRTTEGKMAAFLLLLLAATIFAITRPAREYIHYLHFLIAPVGLIMGFVWEGYRRLGRMIPYALALITAGFVLVQGLPLLQAYWSGQPTNVFVSEFQGGWRVPQTPVTEQIARYAVPGEKLVVWGWRCDYYVRTQMPQGVAENHTVFSVFYPRYRNHYHQRYVADIMRSRPPVFVDATGKYNNWMNDRKTQGHETNAELGRYIAQNYQYLGLYEDTRIYVRKDRMALARVETKK